MPTRLAQQLDLEELVRKESQKSYPALDANWVVTRWLGRLEEDSRKTARILIQMWPEVVSVRLAGDMQTHGAAKT